MTETKTCTKCGETKPLDAFPLASAGNGKRNGTCRACRKARMLEKAASDAANPDQTKRCTTCGDELPVAEFYPQIGGKFGVGGECKGCSRTRAKAWGDANPERKRANYMTWRADNLDAAREATRRWAAANENYSRDKSREKRATPKGKLENGIRWRLWNELKPGAKQGRKTFDLLGYAALDLKAHIEKQFAPGMSWENYSHETWHIDHILPLAAFTYDSPDDPQFKAAWALTNLQPLWAEENHSKGPRLNHPTQRGRILAA